MLQRMLTDLPAEKISINQALADNNMSALIDLIHRLYGSSCYCGVPRLKSTSGLLDKLLQTNKISEIENMMATLNHAIDDILRWGRHNDLKEVFGLQQKTETIELLNK
jgi:two-component system, NarL family, sensor histidine kinase BarA